MKIGLIAGVLFAFLIFWTTAFAQDGERLRKAFTKLDTNKDGKLSVIEYSRVPRMDSRLKGADQDGDGLLSLREFATALVKSMKRQGLNEKAPSGSVGSIRSVDVGQRSRQYLIHKPSDIRADRKTPVVVAFHGGGGNPKSMIRLSGLNEKADEAGFIVVYPFGTGAGENKKLTFNAGNVGGYAMRNNIDDVAFTRRIIADLQTFLNIDQDRIYATGISNGAMMAYRVASELSDIFAAIAPVAGPMGIETTQATDPVSVIHFHGTADKLAPFKGGKGKGAPGVPAMFRPDFYSVDHSIQAWVKANDCKQQPEIESLPDKEDDGMQSIRKTWSGCRAGTEVVLIKIENGGHTWPGRDPLAAFLGQSTRDISANDIIWDFFQKHSRDSEGKQKQPQFTLKPGSFKSLPDTDAVRDASGTGQLFESIHVPGLTDFQEGTNGIAFADFDDNGYLDALSVTTPPFVLSEELKGRQQPRDTLRLMLNQGDFTFHSKTIRLKGSPATPKDFGQGWRGSQIPVVADFNDDGLLDFFVSRQFPGVGDRVREGHNPVGNSLFLADGIFNIFTDVSREMNVLNERAYNRQPSLGDVNQDGFIDIAIGADNTTNAFEGIPKAALMIYQPGDNDNFVSGTYKDIGGTDLIPDFGGFYKNPDRDKAGPKVSLRDIDNDGDLDLFQSTHVLVNKNYDAKRLPYSPVTYRQGIFTWRNMLAETGQLRFKKSIDNGLADEARLTYDKHRGIFVPSGKEVAPGLAYLFFGDVNNDGLLDALAVDGTDALFTPKTEDVGGRFWTNTGDFTFKEATNRAGLETLNHSYGQWYQFFDNKITPKLRKPLPIGRMNKSQPGLPDQAPLDFRPYHGDVIFADFNNDTHLDFVVLDRREPKLLEARALLYMNRGDGSFKPQPTPFSGLDSTGIAGEAVDLNNDGLVDLFISGDPDNTAPDGNADHRYEDKIYLNTGNHGARENNWLRLRFSGISHAKLLGARVEIFKPGTNERIGTRGIYTDHSYKSGSPLEAHFGLGTYPLVDVKIYLPTGDSFMLPNFKGNQYANININDRTYQAVAKRDGKQ